MKWEGFKLWHLCYIIVYLSMNDKYIYPCPWWFKCIFSLFPWLSVSYCYSILTFLLYSCDVLYSPNVLSSHNILIWWNLMTLCILMTSCVHLCRTAEPIWARRIFVQRESGNHQHHDQTSQNETQKWNSRAMAGSLQQPIHSYRWDTTPIYI